MKFRLPALLALAAASAVVAVSWQRSQVAKHVAVVASSPPAVAAELEKPRLEQAADPQVAGYLADLRQRSRGPSSSKDGVPLSQWLETLSPWQLQLAASALRDEPDIDSGLRQNAVAEVLKSLAGKDPYAALVAAGDMAGSFRSGDFQDIASAALPRAASDAPDETAAWFLAHIRDLGARAVQLPREMLACAARRHPDRAFQLIGKLGLTDLREAGEGIGEAMDDPQSRTPLVLAMRLYLPRLGDDLSAEKLRQGVLGGVSSKFHRQPFQESLRWIESAGLDPVEQRSLAEALRPYEDGFIPTAGDAEMADWLAWIESKLTPDRLPGKVEDLVRSWARWFPDSAARWIESSTGKEVREAAVRGFVRQTAASLPDEATRVAMLLPDGGPRLEVLRKIEDARTLRYGYLEERPGE